MNDHPPPVLDTEALRLVAAARAGAGCPACAALRCPGWEALSATFERKALRLAGTLRRAEDEDPTLEEYHPNGTNAWSADAPIAVRCFPYNRCEVWECVGCGRPFLRYTEYGGYYVEERVRELRPELICE